MLVRICTVLLTILALTTSALAEKRFALVIGNSNYATAGTLPNAKNDAVLIEQSFKAMGFETKVLIDADEDTFGAALDDLASQHDDTDVIAVYFAGHGLQKDGINYLVPVDAKLKSESAIERETISLNTLIDIVKPVPISLIFLDACRNNPWADRMIKTATSKNRDISVRRGFAVVRPEGDMMITYATLPNAVASDGAGNNSPFARALARHMGTPDTEVSVLMKRVTNDVLEETLGDQRPQQLSQMKREFYFRQTDGTPKRRDSLQTLLTVYPARVTAGEEVSVVADVPPSCQPLFVNLGATGKVTQIPRSFFRITSLSNGQIRYEISPGAEYGLQVEQSDPHGTNKLGFLCEPKGIVDKADIVATLRSTLTMVNEGTYSGLLTTERFGEAEFRFSEFEIQ
ncbi:Caspase domain-containing protein [Shimia gijangensis]|uniref:Caspase domain-containing protein n=1 Tax=Shimia gijangensis TaxID=1470563 RepID=A0A1M6BLN3_9RHOB|nr:caspase family protein [Shimia gijangensis]SHI49730.1 Caspase domain-containing protein [Shimia gijangensis]